MVRAMLAGVSEVLSWGPELLADLKTAVSEACNNVVMHAYPQGAGALEVQLVAGADAVEVTVSDRGRGFTPGEGDGQTMGIAVIKALAALTQIDSTPGQGTAVHMLFALTRSEMPRISQGFSSSATPPRSEVPEDVVISVTPVRLLAGVLGRIAGCVAAWAHFSIDRYSDLYLVTDGISAHSLQYASGESIHACLASELRQIDVEVGPLRVGTASLLRLEEPASSPMLLAMLVDQVTFEERAGGEAVLVKLRDSRAAVG